MNSQTVVRGETSIESDVTGIGAVREAEDAAAQAGKQFVAVAPLYDQLMHDVPYSEWVVYLHRLLELRNARPRHVLDLACGTGNVTARLAEEGFAVTGVDIAPGMIAEARRKAQANKLPVEFLVQDAAELDLPGKKFDLCISLFDSMNYIVQPERLAMAMERVALHLTRGGLFIFDMNSEYALKNHFFDQSNQTTDAPLRYDWVSDYFADTRLCRIRMRFWYREADGQDRAFSEEHWQYAYQEDEIAAMLKTAGFANVAAYQAYTLRNTHKTSDRIFYIASRA